MVARTYANCLLSFLLSNLSVSAGFWPNSPRFFSLFSVSLLTVQEVVSNEINDLQGGVVCKWKLVGGRDREQRHKV